MTQNDKCSPLPKREDSYECPQLDDCSNTVFQYADVNASLEITPYTIIGKVQTECCGDPVVCCKKNHACSSCEIIITQKVRIKIPISYGVTASKGEEKINCKCCGDCCD